MQVHDGCSIQCCVRQGELWHKNGQIGLSRNGITKIAHVGSCVCRRTMNSHRKLYTQTDEGPTAHRLLHLYEENEAGCRCICVSVRQG